MQIDRLNQSLAPRRIVLRTTPAAVDHLLSVGYDPDFGARPLRRTVQREVQNRLARMILAREVGDGDRLLVDAVDGGIRVERDPEAAPDDAG